LTLARLLALVVALAPASALAATITGRVVHPGRPDAIRGLEVVLLGFQPGGEPSERRTRSDEEGRFRFDDVSPKGAYLVGADYEGIRFAGGSVSFDAAAPDADSQTREVFFHIYDRTSDPSGLELRGVRWTLSRETGAYRVQQVAIVDNSSMKVVVADEGAPPFFKLGLVANRGDLETPFGALPAGVVVDEDGVALRGPVHPGERPYEFAYDLEDPGDLLAIELDLPSAAEWVEVMVQDFGAEIDAGPLHPARPARSADEIYQRFVGFDLPAGTRIPLRVAPLPPVQPLPVPLRVLLVGLIAGALCYFVARPFAAEAGPALEEEAPEDGAEVEKAALIDSLRDLEHDFETGKISAADRNALRAEVRREALQALSRARSLEPAADSAAAEAESTAACECGQHPHPGDRFCSGCGKHL
jgi:hypothetical protein